MTRRRFRPFARFLRSARGSSTVEFVIWFPFFMVLVMSSLETGLLMTRHVMLDRGLDLTVRGLRLGSWVAPTHDQLKAAICDAAMMIPDCMTSLTVELTPVATSDWALPADPVACVDKSQDIQPVTELTPGIGNEMMMIRVCAKFTPFFPTTGLGMAMAKDGAGNYALVAASAFVNEPS